MWLDTSGNFVPDKIPHRETELEKIKEKIHPINFNQPFYPLHIYGKPGTGKTITIKYSIRNLIKDNCKVFYISGKKSGPTEYKIYRWWLEYYWKKETPKKGWSVYDLKNEVFKKLDSEKKIYIIVFDEVDLIEIESLDNLLYEFSRPEIKTNISLITISNSTKFFSELNPRTRSSYNPSMLLFPSYNAIHLTDILNYLAEKGLFIENVERNAIKKIAALSATQGDCRLAVECLRLLANKAQYRNTKIKVDDVDEVFDDLEKEQTIKEIVSLPIHHKYIIKSLYFLDGSIRSLDLYEEYKKMCEIAPLKYRRFFDFVIELTQMGIIRLDKKYGGKGVGTSNFISLDIGKENIKKALVI
jgi:cell division control protein 6